MADERWRNDPDASEAVGAKLRRAVRIVEEQLNDRWPARGQANVRTREYQPLENVSRQGRQEAYRKWPSAKG